MLQRLKSRFNDKLRWSKYLARRSSKADGVRWLLSSLVGLRTTMKVRVAGRQVVIRTSSPDSKVALQCFGGEFDDVIAAMPELEHNLIIDAGGYIGTAAIVFAEAYPHATVVSLEPSSANFSLLKRNVVGYPNIVPVNKALAATPGRVRLKNRGTGEWGFTTVQQPSDRQAVDLPDEVECVTIQDLLSSFSATGVDILKLDIEGGERDLLLSAHDWINRVTAICIELHDRIAPGCSHAYFSVTKDRNNSKMPGEKYLSVARR